MKKWDTIHILTYQLEHYQILSSIRIKKATHVITLIILTGWK